MSYGWGSNGSVSASFQPSHHNILKGQQISVKLVRMNICSRELRTHISEAKPKTLAQDDCGTLTGRASPTHRWPGVQELGLRLCFCARLVSLSPVAFLSSLFLCPLSHLPRVFFPSYVSSRLALLATARSNCRQVRRPPNHCTGMSARWHRAWHRANRMGLVDARSLAPYAWLLVGCVDSEGI